MTKTTLSTADLPPEITRAIGPLRPGWRVPSRSGALVVPVGDPAHFYIKIAAIDGADPVVREAKRLAWLERQGLPAPRVVACAERDGRGFLLTTALPGRPAASLHGNLARENVLAELARAARLLHAVPAAQCPFPADAATRLVQARENLARGLVDAAAFDTEQAGARPESLLADLATSQPTLEDRVVAHGDLTLDNILIDRDRLTGFVDVARLGVCDRHCDLALLHRSLHHRVSPEAAERFLDCYGRNAVDPARLAWYRLLDEFF